MDFLPASAASENAFTGIVLAVIAAFLSAVAWAWKPFPARRNKVVLRSGLALWLWLGALALLCTSGRMPQLPLSGLPFFFVPILVIALAAGLSPFGAQLAAGVPLVALVGFQAFRLPLELVLHSWAAQGTIPSAMTWSGQNWDIVSGVVALVAAPWAARKRWVAWTANLVGFVLLLNVMRVAVLSAPVPFGWNTTPPLLLALHLPYAFIGPVCVGGALLGHLVLTRALLRR